MSFATGTRTITVNELYWDGQGGYWWLDYDTNTRVRSMGYNQQGTVSTAANIQGADTFRQMMAFMINNNVSLPPGNARINVEDIAGRSNLRDQFEPLAITDVQLLQISANYNLVDYLVFMGVFPLVSRFYRIGQLTLGQLGDVLIGLGQADKIDRQKAENVTDSLIGLGNLTQAQQVNFLNRWDNEVGT